MGTVLIDFPHYGEVIWGFATTSASKDDEEGPIYDRAASGSKLEGAIEEAKVI